MKLRVLALDYDGTIAEQGRLHPDVRREIERVRADGLVVVLVTGRMLSDLRRLVGDLSLFDAVVAENGALTAFPRAGRSASYGPRCPGTLLAALRERGVQAQAGSCVVELDARDAHVALEVVHGLELPLTLHFNRGRLMILPQAVSKATGLREALRAMRLSVHNAIGIGDAENDHALLEACEIGAAVAWGSAALRRSADVIVEGSGPRAVADFIRSITQGPGVLLPTVPRRQLVLGRDADGALVSLPVGGKNLLVAGDPRSGKSWVAGLLCEQLLLQGYCACLIDPEGDYAALEALPGVVLLGGDDPPPSLHELERTLRHADVSVIIGLARMKNPEKRHYVLRVLRTLASLRRETGLPHRIVVDEAHYFLHEQHEADVLDDELAGYTLITYRVSELHPDVLAATEHVIVTREADAAEASLLHECRGPGEDLRAWTDTLRGLELDEAALLPSPEDPASRLTRFRLAPRLTHHVRHRHKYMDVPVSEEVAFRLRPDDGRPGAQVASLQELIDGLTGTPAESIEGHIRRGDLSRWIEDVFRDAALADRVRELEERHRLGRLPDFNGAAIHAIQERYQVAGEFL